MTQDLWMLISFVVNITVVFIMLIAKSNSLEKRITRLETYLRIIIRHLDIHVREHDLQDESDKD